MTRLTKQQEKDPIASQNDEADEKKEENGKPLRRGKRKRATKTEIEKKEENDPPPRAKRAKATKLQEAEPEYFKEKRILALYYLLFLMSLCCGVTAETETAFRVDTAGNFFIMHPWILFKILFWLAVKCVVALCVFALIISVIKKLTRKNTPTQVVQEYTGTIIQMLRRQRIQILRTRQMIQILRRRQRIQMLRRRQRIQMLRRRHDTNVDDVEMTLDGLPGSKPTTASLHGLHLSVTELAKGDDGVVVYEGTRDHRTMAVRKITLSDSALESAYHEMRIHHLSENSSSRILRCYGVEVMSGYIYVCLEPYECTLGELIRFCSTGGKDTGSLCEKQLSFLKKHFTERNKCWELSGLPSGLLVCLVKDIVSALADLHESNILHRNLNPDSYFIISYGKKFIAKLGDMSLGKHGEENAIGSQIYLAPEQVQRKNKYIGFENDVFLLGCVVCYLIAAGNHLFNNDKDKSSGTYNTQARELLERVPEAYCFIKNLVAKPHTHRPSARGALAHLFFWPYDRKVNLLVLASTEFKSSTDSKFWSSVNQSKLCMMGYDSWTTYLEQALIDDIDKTYGFYNDQNLADLVRVARNYLVHYNENAEVVKAIVGESQEDILRYFTTKFPQLMVQVYILIAKHLKEKSAFRMYFES